MHKVIIIGSGPAGLTAAIYAARANMKPVVIEGLAASHQPGGQLMITTEVENYPGFPEGITGPKLMELFRAQAERFGTVFYTEDCTKVELTGAVKRVWIESQAEPLEALSVVVATGAVARWLDVPGEKELQNRGVSACATCDGSFFKDQDVVVVGGGDTALEEALYLAGLCRTVTLVHRRDALRASKIMQDRARKHERMRFLWNKVVEEVRDVTRRRVSSVVLRDTVTGERLEHPTSAVFVAIGHVPSSELFRGVLDAHDTGYLKVQGGSTRTNLPGVFACGDVADHVYRQAVSAAGTGCMAALDAERYVSALEA
ncbi:MAG: thioredoxin-disulfide reductase [Deltaproteobacteria bacterium]|nr:thioredoxin-disulfide reductase [Deltaproteobacteria bacterium]